MHPSTIDLPEKWRPIKTKYSQGRGVIAYCMHTRNFIVEEKIIALG